MIIPLELELRFHPDEKFLPCDKNYNEDDSHPVYFNIDEPYMYYGKLYQSVTYFIYYQHNGAIGANSLFVYSKAFGYHKHDKECVKILYDNKSELPVYVFFSAHAQEGKYYHISECEFNNNRLVVYPALNSHSNHPNATINWRIFGLANDYTSNNGLHMIPKLVLDTEVHYQTQNREVFDKPFMSFLLPFYQLDIKNLKQKQKEEEARYNKK
jgi:hypothetical protein